MQPDLLVFLMTLCQSTVLRPANPRSLRKKDCHVRDREADRQTLSRAHRHKDSYCFPQSPFSIFNMHARSLSQQHSKVNKIAQCAAWQTNRRQVQSPFHDNVRMREKEEEKEREKHEHFASAPANRHPPGSSFSSSYILNIHGSKMRPGVSFQRGGQVRRNTGLSPAHGAVCATASGESTRNVSTVKINLAASRRTTAPPKTSQVRLQGGPPPPQYTGGRR